MRSQTRWRMLVDEEIMECVLPKLMSCAKAREYLDTAISDSKIALSRAFRRTVLVCIN